MDNWDSDPFHNNFNFDDYFNGNNSKEMYFSKATESLERLLEYPFKEKDSNGKIDYTYNGVVRVDVVKDKKSRIVRCPIKFLEVVRYIEDLRGKKPSIGLKYKNGSVMNYVHLILGDINEGWIFLDSQRMLQVREIHKIEKIRDHVGLNKIGIIANKIGIPARNEVSRINSERGKIIELLFYDTIHNHRLSDYFE